MSKVCVQAVLSVSVSVAASVFVAGCGGPKAIEDPMAVLASPAEMPGTHRRAMEQLDGDPTNKAYLEALHRMIWKEGFVPEVRRHAFGRLEQWDPEGLKRTIRQQLPRMQAWVWRSELCERIAARNWQELDPALVSSWATRVQGVPSEFDRPEYKALAQMHGADNVTDVVFQMFLDARSPAEQGLRVRCWELLHRLGQRPRLLALLESGETAPDDALLIDLRTGSREMGIVPQTWEEVLWLRKLCEPQRQQFWKEAQTAMVTVPAERRLELELRDLPVVVAAARHAPELLDADATSLLGQLERALADANHHRQQSNQDGFTEGRHEMLHEVDDKLTWGDLAAMHLALRAGAVPEVRAHLFDYAARDRADTTTEYGGVLALDAQGRFEVLEFPPQYREHDQKYVSSQAMMDTAYTSLFHFHFHAQKTRNGEFAGPALGDMNYADSTRANCLVFTTISDDTMNMDFYRHGRIVVDLGELKRPQK